MSKIYPNNSSIESAVLSRYGEFVLLEKVKEIINTWKSDTNQTITELVDTYHGNQSEPLKTTLQSIETRIEWSTRALKKRELNNCYQEFFIKDVSTHIRFIREKILSGKGIVLSRNTTDKEQLLSLLRGLLPVGGVTSVTYLATDFLQNISGNSAANIAFLMTALGTYVVGYADLQKRGQKKRKIKLEVLGDYVQSLENILNESKHWSQNSILENASHDPQIFISFVDTILPELLKEMGSEAQKNLMNLERYLKENQNQIVTLNTTASEVHDEVLLYETRGKILELEKQQQELVTKIHEYKEYIPNLETFLMYMVERKNEIERYVSVEKQLPTAIGEKNEEYQESLEDKVDKTLKKAQNIQNATQVALESSEEILDAHIEEIKQLAADGGCNFTQVAQQMIAKHEVKKIVGKNDYRDLLAWNEMLEELAGLTPKHLDKSPLHVESKTTKDEQWKKQHQSDTNMQELS